MIAFTGYRYTALIIELYSIKETVFVSLISLPSFLWSYLAVE